MTSIKKVALTATMVGMVAFTAACGADENKEKKGSASTQLEGEIKIDGSSTVFPIMEAVVEEYSAIQPGVKVPVGVSGTGGGFEAFIAGETELSNASRPIKDEEAAALKENGIEYTEIKLAFDGLSVVVSKENYWVDYLTIDELKKIWIEDGTVKKWSDIRPEWPEEEIKLYSPGTDSGTFDYFNEVILGDEPIAEKATLSEDDNILVQGVQGDKNGIAYFGYAYYLENKETINVVPIDGGEGPIEPNNATIESGEYAPLSRPLFTYVKNSAVKEQEEVYDFVKFMLENAAELSEDVGYVKLPEDQYTKQLETLETLK